MLSPLSSAFRSALCVALGLCISTLAHAQSGLPSRPLNLTCVAPESPSFTFELERAVLSSQSRQLAANTRESGVLYRGQAAPSLQNHFVYVGEENTLIIESSFGHGGALDALPVTLPAESQLVEGVDSELYVVSGDDAYRVVQIQHAGASAPATLLSATGCFEAADPSIPAAGLIEYVPAAPLWSDGATKRRWIAMPDWQESGSQIAVLPDGDFDFPNGTVLVKEFSIGGVRAETRLMVRDLSGDWTGYSYEWNAAQTDATLLTAGKTEIVNGQEWDYPSPFQCLYCHSVAANRSLGAETAQLNNVIEYSATGISANQITTLVSIGLIDSSIGDVNDLDALPFYDDTSAPIDERARGYLHSNCAGCHRPGGPGQGPEDFRYQLDGEDIGANNVEPWLGNLGVDGAKLLVRGQPDLSVLSLRIQSTNFFRMPPLGTSVVDSQGSVLIEDWIKSGLGFGIADDDADQKADDLDNCSELANVSQLDADGDGYGNRCDPDFNNDGVVNFLDLAHFSNVFLSNDPVADLNGDGAVNFVDLPILADFFFMPPGPSGLIP
ncbi:MAG: dockerin type I domain-containing protein [Gammaproteobacteria bacterium]